LLTHRFFFTSSRDPQDLHSFPTRRSSDLALAEQFEDFELGKRVREFARRRRNEPRLRRCRGGSRLGIPFCVEATSHQALRAQPLRRIHWNRFQAAVAESCRSHINPSGRFHPLQKDSAPKVTAPFTAPPAVRPFWPEDPCVAHSP